MTDAEAAVWLEDHRAELEAIVLTNRMVEEFVPGSTTATLVLSAMVGPEPMVVIRHAKDALRRFAEWSASR